MESALKRFKRKVLQEEIIKDIKSHAFYLKPGQRKRVKSALARKRRRTTHGPESGPEHHRAYSLNATIPRGQHPPAFAPRRV